MWTVGSVLFLVLFGSSVSGTSDLNISAESGDDVILRCGDTNINEDLVFKWTRTDLQEYEYVFFYKDNKPFLVGQHESFKNRVFLNYNQMKDGDLSVILKNVEMEDSGRYECRVLQMDDPQRELKLISSILLTVIPPPPGNTGGEIWGIIALILVLGLIVVVFWICYKKEKAKPRPVFIMTDINADDDISMLECIDAIQKENPDLKVEELKSTYDSETESKIPNRKILKVRRDLSKDPNSGTLTMNGLFFMNKKSRRRTQSHPSINSPITGEQLHKIYKTLSTLREDGSSCTEAAAVDA